MPSLQRSSLFLNEFMEVALTTASGSLFQESTTRWLKNADGVVNRFLLTAISYWCPLRLCVLLLISKNSCLSIFSLPVIILKVSIRSPLRRLFSNTSVSSNGSHNSKILNLLVSFVARLWTCYKHSMSFLKLWDQACTQYSRWGLT